MELEFDIESKHVLSIFKEKDNKNTLKILNDVLSDKDMEGKPNSRDLLDIIEGNMSDDGGALDVDNLEIMDITFNYRSGKGKMNVGFSYSRWFGCAGISDIDNDEDYFSFYIDKSNCKIKLEYFVAPPRDPDVY